MYLKCNFVGDFMHIVMRCERIMAEAVVASARHALLRTINLARQFFKWPPV